MNESFDVVVLGAGFGGSLLAAILSKQGVKVGLIERHTHPRFTIGESSTPAANFLLHDLVTRHGLTELQPLSHFGSWREKCPEILCGCKRGFSYFSHGDGTTYAATPNHRSELLVTANSSRERADTQWYRPDTDACFVQVARTHGVTYLDNIEIIDIEHPRPREWTITIESQGKTKSWKTPFIVDASGTAGELMRRLNLDDWSGKLRTESHAVYSHWNHVRPLDDWLKDHGARLEDYPYPATDSAVHHLFNDGWLWQLRFENGLTSLGYVSKGLPEESKLSADELWAQVCRGKTVLGDVLGSPTLADYPGRLFKTGRLQRLWSQGAGHDWAALPFSVGFIDPLHSTGIAHTLSGIDRLSQILIQHHEQERTSLLKMYSQNVIDELFHIDRLVSACYDSLNNFPLFAACSMLYFAATTTFERLWRAEPHQRPRFLCADDDRFVELVRELSTEVHTLRESNEFADEKVTRLIQQIQSALEPYNRVGLFTPDVPNMYRYTAMENS